MFDPSTTSYMHGQQGISWRFEPSIARHGTLTFSCYMPFRTPLTTCQAMTIASLRIALTPTQIEQQLSQLSGWHWIESEPCLMKSWTFDSFRHVMTCLAHIAEFAEQLDHHPHITTCYNFLQIRLSTHDVSGLSALDFQLAALIDSLIHRNFNTS